jgi:hypothetical protein
MFLILLLAGPWMLGLMVDYVRRLFESIPLLVGWAAMISLTSAEINAWVVAFFFPLARVLAVLVSAPPFNNPALTVRIRLILGLAITLAIAPALPPMPALDPASGAGLLILAQQMLIGFAMGFAMRLVFAAVDLAGSMISLQMGLGFATAYDPQTAGQTGVVSEFLGLLALLVFMAINGHLMVIATLAHSFTAIPVGASTTASQQPGGAGKRRRGRLFVGATPRAAGSCRAADHQPCARRPQPRRTATQPDGDRLSADHRARIRWPDLRSVVSRPTPATDLFEYGLQAMLGPFAARSG